MKKGNFIVVLLALMCMPTIVFAEHEFTVDRFEFGTHAGVGFFVGPRQLGSVTHVQAYDAIYFLTNNINNLKWPGIETFGFSVGYRIDARWQVLLQTTRQRLEFAEELPNKTRPYYYNAMWHLEAMAEYNLLSFGMEMRPQQRIYNVVPYVGLGYGITMYNKEATQPKYNEDEETGQLLNIKHRYPRVGYQAESGSNKTQFTPAGTNLSMYIPMAVGVKWRINGNVQLKGAFHYQLHFQDPKSGKINSNLEGGTSFVSADQIYGRTVGDFHNCLFSLGVIVNFGTWREDNINSTIDF